MEIEGYEDRYEISNDGQVWIKHGTRKGRVKKPYLDRGYPKVQLYDGKKYKCFNAHRLVALAFIPNPNKKPCVNHINGEKDDNRVVNLEWVTHSENNQHAVDTGLTPEVWNKGKDIVKRLKRYCKNCKAVVYRTKSSLARNKTNNVFCNKECANKFNLCGYKQNSKRAVLKILLKEKGE